MYNNIKQTKMRRYLLLISAFIVVFNNEVTCNSLASFLDLPRTLEEKEEPVKEVVTGAAMSNADEVVEIKMKVTYSNDPVISTSRTFIYVALLDSKSPNNVAAVNLRKQNVVGIGLSGEARGNGKQSNTSEDLVNLDVINPKKENVAELVLSGQNINSIR